MSEEEVVEEAVVEEVVEEEVVEVPPVEAKEVDWKDGLSEELKQTADRFPSKDEMIRSIQAFQKREGQVRVPGKDATDDEKAAYQKAVGVPDTPEGYEFPSVPEMTDQIKESNANWAKIFHGLDVPKSTALTLANALNEVGAVAIKAQEQAHTDFAKASEDALRAEWKGDDYDVNLNLANRAFDNLAERTGMKAGELRQIKTEDGKFLMDRPEMVRLYATIGREMAEGTLGPTLSEAERETVDDQVRDLAEQAQAAKDKGESKLANRLYQKEQALREKLGNQPLVGAQARVV